MARTRYPERFLGRKGAPALVQRISEIPEGIVKTESLEGIQIIAAFSRSSVSGWTVAIGIPLAEFNVQLWKSISLLIAGAVLLLLTALLFARVVGERIASAIRSLVAPAMALGHGDPVFIPDLGLSEAEDVGQALVKASGLLRERTSQRDEAERAERELLRVKQQLEQSEALQRGIFEEGPDAILLVAPSGRIVRANREAERLFGHSRQHLLELTVEDLAPAGVRQRHAALRRAFLSAPYRRPMSNGANLFGQRRTGRGFP